MLDRINQTNEICSHNSDLRFFIYKIRQIVIITKLLEFGLFK